MHKSLDEVGIGIWLGICLLAQSRCPGADGDCCWATVPAVELVWRSGGSFVVLLPEGGV
jgi:hypothetical protein